MLALVRTGKADLQARARRAEPGRRGGETRLPTSWRTTSGTGGTAGGPTATGGGRLHGALLPCKRDSGFQGSRVVAFCFVLGF